MDYSRLGVSDKRKELKSVSRRMGSKFLITGFRIFILAIVAVSVIGVVAAFGAFRGILDTTPDVELAVLEVSGFSSKSLYADGTLAQNFAGNAANRIYVEIDRIPQHVRNAFLAAEDWRFYQHSGIDIRTIFRSGYSMKNPTTNRSWGLSSADRRSRAGCVSEWREYPSLPSSSIRILR